MLEGRIIKGIGGLYFVDVGEKIYEANARGIFRKLKITPLVGDFVKIRVISEDKKRASIEKILDRKNELIRPKIANIDLCIITFAAKSPDINFDTLDRFLILSEKININTVICINKADLANKDTINTINRIYAPIYDVFYTCTKTKEGIDELLKFIDKKAIVFAGPSGVGKSSLINCISPALTLKTGEISRKIERGKHTTRQVELIDMGKGTYAADSPGFTSLSLNGIILEKLPYYFKEFKKYLGGCRFNDCLHIKEPDCLIKANIGNGISEERYKRYICFAEEIKKGEFR